MNPRIAERLDLTHDRNRLGRLSHRGHFMANEEHVAPSPIILERVEYDTGSGSATARGAEYLGVRPRKSDGFTCLSIRMPNMFINSDAELYKSFQHRSRYGERHRSSREGISSKRKV